MNNETTNQQYTNAQSISQDEPCTTLDYFISLTIGFVYVFFLSLLVDRLLNYDRVDQICNTGNAGAAGNAQVVLDIKYSTQDGACEKVRNDYNTRKFIYMVVLGVLSIIGGGCLAKNEKYATSGTGIVIGGVFPSFITLPITGQVSTKI